MVQLLGSGMPACLEQLVPASNSEPLSDSTTVGLAGSSDRMAVSAASVWQAALLRKLHAEQTQSRPRKSNDNALAEGKNGSVVRKAYPPDGVQTPLETLALQMTDLQAAADA